MAEEKEAKQEAAKAQPEPKAEAKATKQETKPAAKPAAKPDAKPEAKDGAKAAAKPETKPETTAETKPKQRLKQTAGSRVLDERVSLKSSRIVLNRIRNLQLKKAKNILERMMNGTMNVDRKYYTKTCGIIMSLLTNAEANARAKGMDEERLFIVLAKADKGRTFYRPRSKISRSGEQGKMSHIEIVLGER